MSREFARRFESNVPAGYSELNRVAPGFEEHATGTGQAVALPANALAELPPGIVAEWRADPAGPAYRYMTLRNSVHILNQLHERERDSLVAWFRWCPEGLQEAIIETLAMPPWKAKPLTKGTIAAIENTQEGAVLARHWGGASDRKFAMVLKRLADIRAQVGPDAHAALNRWINSMTPRQLIACCIALSETQ
jgi:hypothetical protein